MRPQRPLAAILALITFTIALRAESVQQATSAPASASPAGQSAVATATTAATFAGSWETTFGRMECRIDGEKLVGTYGLTGVEHQLEGTIASARLTFRYREPEESGEGWFELAADGKSFAGKWHVEGADGWHDWAGKRPAASATGFDGLWVTSFGRMRLSTSGDSVTGTYTWSGIAHVRGKLKDGALYFSYDQPDGEHGSGVFKLGPDSQQFGGTWESTNKMSGAWSGRRITPVQGQVWLVVLEANWESSLAEPEYSYGQMLRSFFTRVPSVQVRHRYIHGVNDVKRWAEEAAFLAEPVVLYISSHGTEQGLSLPGGTVDADALIDCLRDVPTLRLLHFGSCLVMSGDVPKRIAAARTADARFPISGFTKSADWAGSAIVDFTYLELILSRQMSPEDAVAQTRQQVSFAKEESGTSIPGSGLKVYVP